MKKFAFLFLLAALACGCDESQNDNQQSTANQNGSATVCGDGVKAATEICDPMEVYIACTRFNSSITWQPGGAAGCNDTCTQVERGTCNPVQQQAAACNNGILEAGEFCDGIQNVECSRFDSTKRWASGQAECVNCQSLAIGTCKEKVAVDSCEDPTEIVCDGSCMKKCENDQEPDANCNCPDDACANSGKIECKGACYDKCPIGSELDKETCECSKPSSITCPTGKKECNDDCYFECDGGEEFNEDCECPTPQNKCEKNNDCPDDKPICNSDGSCVDSVCGDGIVTKGKEICDPKDNSTMNIPCADFDSNKSWQEGGKAECASDCKKFSQGTCKEIEPELCGNGTKDKGEACDYKLDEVIPCKKYDSNKIWKDGGQAECSKTCNVEVGSCEIDPCGNGVLDEGEACDFGSSGNKLNESIDCSTYDPEYKSSMFFSSKAKCTDKCKKINTDKCDPSTKKDIYYCQLMEPVEIKFSEVNEVTINAHYAAGSNVDLSEMVVEVAVGEKFNMSTWKAVDTKVTNDTSKKNLSAKLKATDMLNTTTYYTFRVKESADADDWKYCQKNEDYPSMINGDIKYCEDALILNTCSAKKVGIATGVDTSTLPGETIAQFSFDKINSAVTDPTTEYEADAGEGKIAGSAKVGCNNASQGGCYILSDPVALNVKGWAAEYSANAEAYLLISELNAKKMGDIKLQMKVYRTNKTTSPTHIAVLYSTDGKNYSKLDTDIELSAKEKKFETYYAVFPDSLKKQSNVSIKLIPYGGSGLIRLDDILVSGRKL